MPDDAFADEQWRSIAERAANLRERIEAFRRGRSRADPRVAVDAGDAWRQAIAAGDESRFAHRLSVLGIRPEDVPGCLADPDLGGEQMPSWCGLLARVTKNDGVRGSLSIDRRAELLPLLTEALIAPAFDDLSRARPSLLDAQSHELRADLLRDIQDQLAALLAPVVAAEFDKARLPFVASGVPDPWQHWMQTLRAGGLMDLWVAYPALARLVATALAFWVDRAGELLDRAVADAGVIGDAFGYAGLRLVRAASGLSDRHRGGATVVRCTFIASDGESLDVIYKPRDLHAEVIFAEFTRWMNDAGTDIGAPLRVLARDGYGWVECVDTQPVDSHGGVEQYFRRCGVLAAMLFALGATDCTSENLMAAGDRPVVLDAETMLAPKLRVAGEGHAGDALPSVLDTLLLPRWMPVQGRVVDLSAMGTGEEASQPRVPKLRWVDAGTTDAYLDLVEVEGLSRHSDLRDPGGELIPSHEHREAILRGFDQGWNAIARHGEELFGPAGTLTKLRQVEVRVLLRMTAMYVRLLDSSLNPARLADGLQRSLHFEPMTRYWLNRGGSAADLALAQAECDQTEQGDVPMFTTVADSIALAAGAESSALEFTESAFDRARSRVALMSDATEHVRQRSYIEAALAVAPPAIRTNLVRPAGPPSVAHQNSEMGAGLRDEAVGVIVRRVARDVVEVPGGVAVVSLNASSVEQWSIAPMDASLGHGYAGLALSLLIAARTGSQPDAEELAVAMLVPSVNATIDALDRFTALRGRGFERGLDGLAFGWRAARDLVTSLETRGMLDGALAVVDSDLESAKAPGAHRQSTSVDSRAANLFGDALVGGVAGQVVTGESDALVNALAARTIDGRLNLGVPNSCPVQAFGLNFGLAGILYALATSGAVGSSARLDLPRLTD